MKSRDYRRIAVLQTLLIFALVPLGRPLQFRLAEFSAFTSRALQSIPYLALLAAAFYCNRIFKHSRLQYPCPHAPLQRHFLFTVLLISAIGFSIRMPVEYVHALLFGALGCLILLAFEPPVSWFQISLAVLYGSLVGVADELLQLLHPQRVCDLRDILLDGGCVMAGVVLTLPFVKVRELAGA